jgi:hypothetical protein
VDMEDVVVCEQALQECIDCGPQFMQCLGDAQTPEDIEACEAENALCQ